MQRLEIECPNTFALALPKTSHFNPKNWVSQEYRLFLICQHPQGPHQVGKGYSLREEKELWIKIRPWLDRLIFILKIGVPMGKAVGAVYDEFDVDRMKNQITLMEEIAKELPQITTLDTLSDTVTEPHLDKSYQAVGVALRALHSFLMKVDPNHVWGGLNKMVTPDGNILWLCNTHRRQYEAKPLDQRYI